MRVQQCKASPGHHCLLVQERDPRSYQIFLQLPSGATFLGSTPEQLYMRSGPAVASEAVAATRPRGPAGSPLLTSPFPACSFMLQFQNSA